MAEERGWREEDPEGMVPEELGGQEFMAGWFDGFFSAQASLSHRLCQDLARFSLTLDGEGNICPLAPGAPPSKLEGLYIDNPQHNADYQKGWERGFEQTTYQMLKRVAAALPRHGLSLVSEQGRPFTPREVDEGLVNLYSVRIVATRPTRLDDAALHLSLDRALQEQGSSAIPFVTPAPPSPAQIKSSSCLKQKGVLTMIRKHIDRRAALISLSTVLACGALSYAFWPRSQQEARHEKTQTTPEYVAPAWLHRLPSVQRKLFGSWDRAFWLEETAGTQSNPTSTSPNGYATNMAALVQSYMSQTGNDGLKANVAGFLGSSDQIPSA